MMGFAFTDLDMPVTKGTSGITVLTHDDLKKATETACIRCGQCVDACPMNLVPCKLAVAARHGICRWLKSIKSGPASNAVPAPMSVRPGFPWSS